MAGAGAAALLAATPETSTLRIALLEPKPVTPPAAGEPLDLRVSALSRASQRLLELHRRLAGGRGPRCRGLSAHGRSGRSARTPDGPGALHLRCGRARRAGSRPHRREPLHPGSAARRARGGGRRAAARRFRHRSTTGDDAIRVTTTDDGRIPRRARGRRRRRRIGRARAGRHRDARLGLRPTRGRRAPRRREAAPATAWQRFLDTGPLALLPLADGRVSLVWSTIADTGRGIGALQRGGIRRARHGRVGRRAGPAAPATTARASFPLRLLHARHYAAPRIALIGDAAHTVHPLAGQGINLAFMDAAALVDVVGVRRSTRATIRASCAVLRRYERWRKAEALPAIALLDGIKRLFYGGNDAAIATAPGRARPRRSRQDR